MNVRSMDGGYSFLSYFWMSSCRCREISRILGWMTQLLGVGLDGWKGDTGFERLLRYQVDRYLSCVLRGRTNTAFWKLLIW